MAGFPAPADARSFRQCGHGRGILRVERGIGGVGRDRHGDDHPRLSAPVVDDHERVGEDEARIGIVERPTGRIGQPLDVTHDIVGEKSERAAPERAEFGRVHRVHVTHDVAKIGDRIGGRARAMPAGLRRPVFHHAIAQSPGTARFRSHVRVAGPGLAPRHGRLEEKGKRTATEFGERGNGGAEIEQAIAPDRYEAAGRSAALGAGPEFGERSHHGKVRRTARHRASDHAGKLRWIG